ncbi:MAG TPA: hypothetical protein VKQ32_08190 [Polyangia bacterium]|nr:hypothetical protein [Polyangia bacterium]
MQTISDEYMREMLTKTRTYSLLILRPGPRMNEPGADKIIWEHGRRNFALRAERLLSIVCPVGDDTVAGVGIFDAPVDQVDGLMKDDPAVKEGVLLYELHACRSFPGDSLPG